MTTSLRGSHGLSARRARRTKSRRPKGLQLELLVEVGARRAPRLLVCIYIPFVFVFCTVTLLLCHSGSMGHLVEESVMWGSTRFRYLHSAIPQRQLVFVFLSPDAICVFVFLSVCIWIFLLLSHFLEKQLKNLFTCKHRMEWNFHATSTCLVNSWLSDVNRKCTSQEMTNNHSKERI